MEKKFFNLKEASIYSGINKSHLIELCKTLSINLTNPIEKVKLISIDDLNIICTSNTKISDSKNDKTIIDIFVFDKDSILKTSDCLLYLRKNKLFNDLSDRKIQHLLSKNFGDTFVKKIDGKVHRCFNLRLI
jgi:hypothetical protein